MTKNKEVFTVYQDKDGKYYNEVKEDYKKVELAVRRPTNQDQQNAQKAYAAAFREFVEAGAIVRPQLDSVLRSRNMWDDARQKESDTVSSKISDNILKLKKGGIKFSEAVKLAKDTIKLRNDLFRVTIERNQLDQNTAEAQAENVRFNYLIAACTVFNNDGKLVFESYDDYKKQDGSGNVVVGSAGEAFWKLTSGLDDDYRKEWAEYKFLLKYKLCNDKLQLVDRQGRLVDLDDNYIDEQGRFVKYDETGNKVLVNRNGDLVDEKGELVVESKPFIDDDGNPMLE